MPKRTTAFDLPLPLRDAETPAYRRLYEALRSEILDGRLGPGARLPATRDLARQYQLSRGTIVNAFELLKSEGYLEGSIGSGTYVSKVLPDDCCTWNATDERAGDRQPRCNPDRGGECPATPKRVRLFPALETRPAARVPSQHTGAGSVSRQALGAACHSPLAAGLHQSSRGVAIPWDIGRSKRPWRITCILRAECVARPNRWRSYRVCRKRSIWWLASF